MGGCDRPGGGEAEAGADAECAEAGAEAETGAEAEWADAGPEADCAAGCGAACGAGCVPDWFHPVRPVDWPGWGHVGFGRLSELDWVGEWLYDDGADPVGRGFWLAYIEERKMV